MNKLLKDIEEDIEAIQLDYDVHGYVSTNQADDLIRHCQTLLQIAKAKEVNITFPQLPESEAIRTLQNQAAHWKEAYHQTYLQLIRKEGIQRAASAKADI